MDKTHIYISWQRYHRRPVVMKDAFDFTVMFSSLTFGKRRYRLVEHLLKSFWTVWVLLKEHPSVVWVQLPPTYLLYIVSLYRLVRLGRVTLVADCHNATFSPKWINMPGILYLLSHSTLALVHNDVFHTNVSTRYPRLSNLYVLQDRVEHIQADSYMSRSYFMRDVNVLFACSFSRDEPLKEVLKAAQRLPDVGFIITGDTGRAQDVLPLEEQRDNVVFTGYIPTNEFNALLCSVDVVLGLTLFEGVQLCIANEAVSALKPLVLSDTKALRQLFNKGAIYVDSRSSQSIALGICEAINRRAELQPLIKEMYFEKENSWKTQADIIKETLVLH